MKISRKVAITRLVDQADDWDLETLLEYAKQRREAYFKTLSNEKLGQHLDSSEDEEDPFVVRGRR